MKTKTFAKSRLAALHRAPEYLADCAAAAIEQTADSFVFDVESDAYRALRAKYSSFPREAAAVAHGAAGLAKAALRIDRVSPRVLEQRRAICLGCEYNTDPGAILAKCEWCGCNLPAKQRLASEHCPDPAGDRWWLAVDVDEESTRPVDEPSTRPENACAP